MKLIDVLKAVHCGIGDGRGFDKAVDRAFGKGLVDEVRVLQLTSKGEKILGEMLEK